MPRIVAEALTEVPDPLEAALRLGASAPAVQVLRGIVRSLAIPEADVPPPAWLRPEQVAPFRRVVAALEAHGGALLADPVGSGKTWIALASARATGGPGPAVAVVPAVLRPQWERAAIQAEVPLEVISHETVSRGTLPAADPRVVVIDECHHFREPGTRRYRTLAPWLVGRRTLLLSATPVVNRLQDLAHQLLLAVRDDVFHARACPSLTYALGAGAPPAALGEIVLCRPAPGGMPALVGDTVVMPDTTASRALTAGIARLELSRDPGIAALIRLGLWRALASSPAALAGALGRAERLLAHAAAARNAGRPMSRAALRTFTADDPDQLLMWEFMPDTAGPLELVESDVDAVRALRTEAEATAHTGDRKHRALRHLLGDERVTVVFTASRDTLHWLRRGLADLHPAWVCGVEAGIGPGRTPREMVLRWFGRDPPRVAELAAPRILLATDVAAEGLDLQRASRVVHYDLPWTSVRLDQRAGRARRLGALHPSIVVTAFHPPPLLERRIRQLERLALKRGLAREAGLGAGPDGLLHWRINLAAQVDEGVARSGVAVVRGAATGWLVGLAFEEASGRRPPATLLWVDDAGSVSDAPSRCVPRLLEALEAPECEGESWAWDHLRHLLLPVVRERLAAVIGAAWTGIVLAPDQRSAVRRLERCAAAAARRRNGPALAEAERALAAVGGGLRSGEAMLLHEGLALDDAGLQRTLRRIPPRGAESRGCRPVITGIVRVTTFPACATSAPSCSTSTGRSSTRSS